jgi:hypothetical protein
MRTIVTFEMEKKRHRIVIKLGDESKKESTFMMHEVYGDDAMGVPGWHGADFSAEDMARVLWRAAGTSVEELDGNRVCALGQLT